MTMLDALARRILLRRLTRLGDGRLSLVEAGSHSRDFGPAQPGAPTVTMTVRDPRFYRAVVLGGHLGSVEAYLDGWWDTDDLTALVQLMVRNRDVLDSLESGWARLLQPLRRAWHTLRRNTRRGSRRNIAAHYDLGNEFFAEFLDDTLTYSCGIFEQPHFTLRDASIAKYERICRKLALAPGDHVLEIGTGWGGFAMYAAGRYGCRVTTTTISRAQHTLASERIAAAGLADRVTVLQHDYRDLTGTYDKLVSIEMIEAVGHKFYGAFFRKCAELLRPGGRMALQAITIDPRFYHRARREVDFIKRYMFPGANIPSLPVLRRAAEARARFSLLHLEDITPHYAETLKRWRQNFAARWDRLRAQGFSEEFRRLWQFYFCYCEGGFRERFLGDVQLVFERHPATA
ncbi:MAG TPA: cyclopropane-fatty-acyl-phospholipid synthase family protein [Gemmatimonadales bacterium]|nr:cyclopropane-fatty-acyl-phospholipid synthase family protein [Gemmatimonadales bacterium]